VEDEIHAEIPRRIFIDESPINPSYDKKTHFWRDSAFCNAMLVIPTDRGTVDFQVMERAGLGWAFKRALKRAFPLGVEWREFVLG